MALMAAGIGAVGSIAGGLLGGKSSTPKYRPFDVTSGFGTVDYDKKGRTINATLSPEQQAWANQYGGLAQNYLGGGPYAGVSQWATGAAGGAMPGLFQGALDSSMTDPYSLAAYMGQINPMQAAAGQAGMNLLGGPAAGYNQAMQMFNAGQGFLGAQPQSYQNIYDQRLNLLRQQAAPQEEQATNSMFNRLFGQGRLGSTGGGRDLQAFATGLAQADTTRQLDAMNLSEALYGRDLSAALQQQGMGANMMQAGMGGLINAQANQVGNAYNLFGLSGNLAGQGLGAMQNYNALVNSRAQQRMTNAMDLFGFGNTLGQQSLQTGMGLQDAQSSLFANLFNTAALGHQAGQGAMGGGSAGPTWQNALGGALSGLGSSMMSNPQAWGNAYRSWNATSGLSPINVTAQRMPVPSTGGGSYGGGM